MEQVNQALIDVLTTVITGVITLVGIYCTIYIKKAIEIAKEKSEQIKDKKAKIIVNDVLDKTCGLICTNITALENTTKQEILEDIKDGKVDKSELNNLAIKVKENVLNQLGEDSLKVLNETIGDTDKYLSNKIEQQLAQMKLDPNCPVQKTILPEITQEVKTNVELQNANVQLLEVNKQLTIDKDSLQQEKQKLEQDKIDLENKLNQVQSVLQPISNTNTL